MDQWLHNTRGLVVVGLAIATGLLLLAVDPGNGFPTGVGASTAGGAVAAITTTTLAPGPTTTTTPPVARPTLQQNSTDTANVTALQQRLAALGYSVTVDGKFGAGTKTAVSQFQTAKGLPSDGIVNQATWTALDNAK